MMSRYGSVEGGVLFRQPAVESAYISSFHRRLESLTAAPAKEKSLSSDGFFADEPYLRLVPEKEIDRRKRKRLSFAGSICEKNNVNLFITECSSRSTKVRLQHQASCNISDEDLKSEILADVSGSSLARTRPSWSKLQSQMVELSYPSRLSPQEKTTSCESNKHMGGTRFAEDDHVDVRWMYLSHQDKMSGVHMLEHLYLGYEIGILRQDLPLYGVRLGKFDNPVALKSVSNLKGPRGWHSCSNSYFQQLPNSSWTYPEREEADAHKHIRGSNFFDNNDVSNFVLPGSSPEGDTRCPQNVKVDHACAKTTQDDLSSSKEVGKVPLVNSNVENDWPAVLPFDWKGATSWFLDKLHDYTMQYVKEYIVDESISWHFQNWRPLAKQPRTLCSCSLAGSEETHSAVLSDRFMHQGFLPLGIPETVTLNYPAKAYVGLTGDSIPTGFEELTVAVARFYPPQKNTLQTDQYLYEEKFAGSDNIEFSSNTGVHMCSQKKWEEKKSSLFHANQFNHMTMSSELSNVDVDLVAESSSSMSGRSDVDILAFSLSEQHGDTLSDPGKNIVFTLLEPALSSNCRNSQEAFESSVQQMKSPESSQLEVLGIVYDELQKSVLKGYCRYVFDAFISEHITKVVRKRVGSERNKGLQSCKDVDAISNSCCLSCPIGCEARHTVRGPSHYISKVIYADPNRRMDFGTRKESTQQEAVSNMADFFGQNRFDDRGRDFDCLSRHFVSTNSRHGSPNRQDQVTGSAEKMLPSLNLVEEMLLDLNKPEQTIDFLKSSSDSLSSYVDQSTGACYQRPQRFHDSSKMTQLDEEVRGFQQIHPVAPAAELKGFAMDKRAHMDEKVQISPNRRKGRTKSLRKLIQCIPRIKSEEVSKELSRKKSYTSITKVDSFSDIQDADSAQLSSYGCARCSVDGWEWHRGLWKPQPKEQAQARSNVAFQVDQNCIVKDTKTHVVGVQSSLQTARMTRVQMRKLAAGLESLNMLKLIQLKARRKKLKVQKSNIHIWGVFALEPIDSGDFVVEYIGEVIRSKVSDVREHQYEKMGIGSSYLFRIDNEHVVDATKRGGIARFINHSCNPNCYTKIVTLDGQKKVFIYSKKCILAGDELTYDYKFPLEEKKIPCKCGSTKCRGSLN